MSSSAVYNITPGSDEAVLSGFFESAGDGTAEQLPALTIIEVLIQSDADNSDSNLIYIGGSTVASDGSGGGCILSPGDSLRISVTNLNLIYMACDSVVILNYIALTEAK